MPTVACQLALSRRGTPAAPSAASRNAFMSLLSDAGCLGQVYRGSTEFFVVNSGGTPLGSPWGRWVVALLSHQSPLRVPLRCFTSRYISEEIVAKVVVAINMKSNFSAGFGVQVCF